jgi:hypothetical protein
MSKLPIVVNLFAGPGAKKSTIMHDVIAKLKWDNINVEMAPEFAKELTWEERTVALRDQLYIFGKQNHRQSRLVGQVDVVITDSPLPLSTIYAQDDGSESYEHFCKLVWARFHECNNMNFFVRRVKPYHEAGRSQTEQEAIYIDNLVQDMLINNDIRAKIVEGNEDGARRVFWDVLDTLKEVLV